MSELDDLSPDADVFGRRDPLTGETTPCYLKLVAARHPSWGVQLNLTEVVAWVDGQHVVVPDDWPRRQVEAPASEVALMAVPSIRCSACNKPYHLATNLLSGKELLMRSCKHNAAPIATCGECGVEFGLGEEHVCKVDDA